jgi:hypothetical protein
MLSKLSDSGFTSRPFEIFLDNEDKNRPCISMERVGINLQSLRMSNRGQWPSETLGSIGVALIDAVDKLHNNYHVIHKDLHLGNVCLGDNQTSDKLYIIDFGEMKELQTDIAGTTEFYKLEEVRQVVLSIRFLFDGDDRYYVTKRYTYKKDDACKPQVPSALCDALEYVFTLPSDSPDLDYQIVRKKFVELAGGNDSNKILWKEFHAKIGTPKDLVPRANTMKTKLKNANSDNLGPPGTQSTTRSSIVIAPLISMTLLFVIL